MNRLILLLLFAVTAPTVRAAEEPKGIWCPSTPSEVSVAIGNRNGIVVLRSPGVLADRHEPTVCLRDWTQVTDWTRFARFAAVVLTPEDWARVPDSVRALLDDYRAAGGIVALVLGLLFAVLSQSTRCFCIFAYYSAAVLLCRFVWRQFCRFKPLPAGLVPLYGAMLFGVVGFTVAQYLEGIYGLNFNLVRKPLAVAALGLAVLLNLSAVVNTLCLRWQPTGESNSTNSHEKAVS